jgi:hypothetical protein
MLLETLESRLFLFAYSLSAGKISITTSGGKDIVTANISGGGSLTVKVKEGAAAEAIAYAGPAAAVTSFSFNLAGDNDSINLQNCTQPASIQGANGDDTIYGGYGNDTIRGNADSDKIHGSLGSDLLDGGADNDLMDDDSGLGGAGSGFDTADYSGRIANVTADLADNGGDGEVGENDTIGSEVDSIMGGAGNDTLTGNANANYLSGGAGNDSLRGGDNNDVLCGGAGRDTLLGEGGNDAIFAWDGEVDVIDGGAGTNSAQTDPAEAAAALGIDGVPTGDVPDPTTQPLEPFMGPLPSPDSPAALFSRQRIAPRPIPAKRTGGSTPTSSGPIVAAAAPPPVGAAPLGAPPVGGPPIFPGDEPKNIEIVINDDNFDQFTRTLVPYTLGQVSITRNFQGVVNVRGTNLDDDIEVQTFGQQNQLINVTLNGGLTQWPLPSPTVVLANRLGSDSLDLLGNRKDSTLNFLPSERTGVGQILLDEHRIFFGTAGPPITDFTVGDLSAFRYVTPLAGDQVTVFGPDAAAGIGGVTIKGASNQAELPTVQLNGGISLLTLDTGTNDLKGGNPTDQIEFANLPSGLLPAVQLITTNPQLTDGKDQLDVINSSLRVVNNPTPDKTIPALGVNVSGEQSSLQFLAPLIQLAGLNINGGAVSLFQGDQLLYTRSLQLSATVPSFLDLADGNLVVDHNGPVAGGPDVAGYVRSQIFNAYGQRSPEHWTNPGITSAKAAANPSTGLGYVEAAELFGKDGGVFHGLAIDGTATLVSFTLRGDSNLDRKVDFTDLVHLAQNYNNSSGRETWFHGEFTYDGRISFEDLVALAQNYNQALK